MVKTLLPLMLVLVACGPEPVQVPERIKGQGLVLDLNTERFEDDIKLTIHRQALTFGVPAWEDEIQYMTIKIRGQIKAIDCGGTLVSGCSKFYDGDRDLAEIDVVLYQGINTKYEHTDIDHELRHIFLCVFEECDPKHENRNVWGKVLVKE